MKFLRFALLVLSVVGFSSVLYAANESNPIAIGVEKVTKAPFQAVKGGGNNPWTSAVDFTSNARAAVVSVGLNLGKPVEE